MDRFRVELVERAGYVLDAISPQRLTICHAYGTGEGCGMTGKDG
ncbi:MAG: hypothetical protein ACLVJ6_03640 [Merdibacter sp.]